MPFCTRCGKEVEAEATFCYNCGQALPKAPPAKPAPPQQPVAPMPQKPAYRELPPPEPKGSRNVPLIVALLVIAVAVAVLGYAFAAGYFSGGAGAAQTGTGAMSVYQYEFYDSSHLAVNIKNTGSKVLVISSAFLDGAGATISPAGYSLGINELHAYSITLASGVSGGAHQLRIVASDGTPVQCSVTYQPPAGVGSMIIYSYAFVDSTHIAVNVTNTGTKVLVIAQAYVDGASVSISPAGYNLGVGNSYVYSITLSSALSAGAHQLRIIASDGTPVQISIVRT